MFTSRTLEDVIKGYLTARAKNEEAKFVGDLVEKMQEEMKTGKPENKIDIVQQVIFLNLRGFDTTWADFCVLEVMSLDSFSAKRIAYTAAAQMWNSTSDAVLMATNRIKRDLTSIQPLMSSIVLTSLPPYLSLQLSQTIAHDVIALMSAAKPIVRQKAIMTFYHICLKYPEALRPGFTTLKSRLDDGDNSVVFAALSVMCELCAHNVQNFVGLIPKFHKMLESSSSNWVSLRLIHLLRMLSAVEPRLPKKLISPFTTILETTSSITVLFECVRTIIDIPITNPILLVYATQRMQAFLEHEDNNLRYLCLSLFIKLIQIQPKLVAQNKDLITKCLDSSDEATRLLSLDLLAALANAKTVDGIVAKIFDYFKESKSINFKDQLFTKIITICSKDDYALVTDFDWYISILMDFISEGGFSCYDVVSEQLMDLALRVPDMRKRLVIEMGGLFENIEFKDATQLLLIASHIIAEYSEDSKQFEHILQPIIANCDERVQESCISTAFTLYLKAKNEEEKNKLLKMFEQRLGIFETSTYPEVQDITSLIKSLLNIIKSNDEISQQFKDVILKEATEDFEPIERPSELDEPIELFKEEDEENAIDELNTLVEDTELTDSPGSKNVVRKKQHKIRTQNLNAHKPVILKSKNEKKIDTNIVQKPKSRPAVLSNDLANVDLTEIIAEEEAKALPRPMPYDQSELLKQQQIRINNSNNKHGKRKHHNKKSTETKAKVKPQQNKPQQNVIVGPKPHSRIQQIGENSSMLINATEFYCTTEKPNILTIDLSIQNQSNSLLTAIDISLQTINNNIRPISLPSYNKTINPGEIALHKIEIEFTTINIPQKIKILFVPTDSGAETLEANLRIFPSFFLLPGNNEDLDKALEVTTCVEKLKPITQQKPNDVLQLALNVLRSTIIKNNNDPQTRTLYSKNTLGDDVICILKIDLTSIFVELRTTSPELAKALILEMNMKLRLLMEG
ncbi:Adaptin N terminal region family protein [Histomonas meleagridis]|uniref:Adaptin N terminal region family protein n=1 Tax=Histomonas meleagridis TaxID=135588 RepID=UPI00355A5E36|nr:Adaptin N terminal region family protein [Histomonas meleagridis]KAH0799803.1 Adaptin N terminal region family protein [Histomonas meleagridis]